MINQIIPKLIKDSVQYNLNSEEISFDNHYLNINDGKLQVILNTKENLYRINGDNEEEIKKLHSFIEKGIGEPLKIIALEKIDEGVEVWNKWRKEFEQIRIDISQLSFSEIDFSGINLKNVDLSYTEFENVILNDADFTNSKMHETRFISCNLERANLINVEANLADFSASNLNYSELNQGTFGGAKFLKADLQGIELKGANLRYADLSGSDLRGSNLSGLILNPETNFKKAKGVEKGINGYWNSETNSAALFSNSPQGNSMKGPNIEAVLESLKRARKFFGFSFILSLGAVLIWYLNQDETTIPFLRDFVLTKNQYLSISLIFSLGLLVLSKSFLDDAFIGMKYLEDRKSAMAVGSFPWALTKFAGKKCDQRFISFISRIVLSFHPILYWLLLDSWKENFFQSSIFVITTLICIWIFIFSFNFQKPILFDQNTEKEKSNESI